ncbi:MAG: pyridoxamine 5'-phosphate oxidase family protein [Flavobacteriales bacterium]|nr:pyridoxamine 5'-phosphate oxidase family protein [Flavobacteriales bacterium]
MDKKILSYIQKNKVLTIATCVDNQPYCAICFYVFDIENKVLIFLSDNVTRHISEALKNKQVAGTITTKVTTVAKIQGIQFTGEFINPDKLQANIFYDKYYEKFPFAKAKPSPIWGIKLTSIKMTDNTLGFGKKLLWEEK